MKLDRSILWPLVALLAVLGALALGGLMLLPSSDRTDLVHSAGSTIAPAITTILAAIGALVAAFVARASHKETQAQTPVLEQIKNQTNGQLDGRIDAAIERALNARNMTEAEVGALPDGVPYPPIGDDTSFVPDGIVPVPLGNLVGRA